MKSIFDELRLNAVTRRFAGVGGAAFNALSDLTMTIKRGEFIALLGPSGCGKSTALNCIAGLLPLSGGTIMLDETRIDTLPPEQRGFGMVFQNYALFPHMPVEKNVGFGLRMRGVGAAETATRRRQGAQDGAADGQEHKLPGQLSGGQQQRVAIARAIVIEPPLILMDEPLSNLDAKLRIETRAEIRRIHTELGRATIYVTHDQDEALSLADRIVVMKDGVAQQIAPPQEVYAQPSNLHVARFMGYRNVLELDVEREEGERVTLAVPASASSGPASFRCRAGAAASRFARMRRCWPLPRRQCDRRRGHQRRILRPRFAGRRAHAGRYDPPRARRTGPAGWRRRARPGFPSNARWCIRDVAMATADSALAREPFDRTLLLVAPAGLFMLLLFIYPFLYGLWLSFTPKEGGALANYTHFFNTDNLWPTIWTTLRLALRRRSSTSGWRCRSRSRCASRRPTSAGHHDFW